VSAAAESRVDVAAPPPRRRSNSHLNTAPMTHRNTGAAATRSAAAPVFLSVLCLPLGQLRVTLPLAKL